MDGPEFTAGEQSAAEWPPAPRYAFEAPTIINTVTSASLSRLPSSSTRSCQHFWRHVAWSPNGSHLLAQSDDHRLDLYRLDTESGSVVHVLSVRAPATLLAFAWYPFATQEDPSTWCFVMSARDVTVKLVDAFEGKTRATYGIIDHTERFIGPQAMAFSLDGARLYCAHETSLSIFELARPGVNTHASMRLSSSHRATRKGKAAAGQRGSISSISVAPDSVAGTDHEIVVVGTFAGSVGVYRMDVAVTNREDACLMGWKEESSLGISQVSFHPITPHILFVASRRVDGIRAYDLRYVGSRRSFLHPPAEVALVAILSAPDEACDRTQQRICFHLDWAGRYLVSGNSSGHINVWDVAPPSATGSGSQLPLRDDDDDTFFGRILKPGEPPQRLPQYRWRAAQDVIPSVSFHPLLPLLAVASGSRRWPMHTGEEDGDEVRYARNDKYIVRDGALRLYQIARDDDVPSWKPTVAYRASSVH